MSFAELSRPIVVRIRRSRNSTPTSLGTALATTSLPHLVLRARGTRRLSPLSARNGIPIRIGHVDASPVQRSPDLRQAHAIRQQLLDRGAPWNH